MLPSYNFVPLKRAPFTVLQGPAKKKKKKIPKGKEHWFKEKEKNMNDSL